MALVDVLIQGGWLKTDVVIESFRKIKREDFLPEELKKSAELNMALPIGFGQTISQPLTVAFMLELLEPQKGEKILDIGSGSGWTTALLSYIVGQEGKVVSLEIIPELKKIGEENVLKYNFIKKGIAECILADASQGYKAMAPYDKILASASGENLPIAWKKQLNIGGRIVCPIGSSIWLFIKKTENDFESVQHPGFSFVPLVSKK